MYIESWRAANAGLHGGLSNGVIWASGTPIHTTILVLKGSYGLIWTRKRARMCNRSYRIAAGAPPEQSDLCLLCGAAADTAGHVFGGCEKLEAVYTARHNGAGLLTLKALARGPQGGCFWLSDVTSVKNTPEFSSGTRLPQKGKSYLWVRKRNYLSG